MTATATEQASVILERVDRLRGLLDGQVLVSQSRWVDHLLDLFNLVEPSSLRQVVGETLSAISNLRAIEVPWMVGQFETLASAIEIESIFDALVLPSR
jgi:hypothetical protein